MTTGRNDVHEEPRVRRRTRWGATAILVGLVGLAAGLGGFTFVFADGASYLRDDPAACANCHVMNDQFAGWTAGSHRAVAGCNDCHTPPGTLAKYSTKALNGYLHSWAFTTGRFDEPIRITERNLRVTEQACRHCHQPVVEQIEGLQSGVHASSDPSPAEQISCVRCHYTTGHP